MSRLISLGAAQQLMPQLRVHAMSIPPAIDKPQGLRLRRLSVADVGTCEYLDSTGLLIHVWKRVWITRQRGGPR